MWQHHAVGEGLAPTPNSNGPSATPIAQPQLALMGPHTNDACQQPMAPLTLCAAAAKTPTAKKAAAPSQGSHTKSLQPVAPHGCGAQQQQRRIKNTVPLPAIACSTGARCAKLVHRCRYKVMEQPQNPGSDSSCTNPCTKTRTAANQPPLPAELPLKKHPHLAVGGLAESSLGPQCMHKGQLSGAVTGPATDHAGPCCVPSAGHMPRLSLCVVACTQYKDRKQGAGSSHDLMHAIKPRGCPQYIPARKATCDTFLTCTQV